MRRKEGEVVQKFIRKVTFRFLHGFLWRFAFHQFMVGGRAAKRAGKKTEIYHQELVEGSTHSKPGPPQFTAAL